MSAKKNLFFVVFTAGALSVCGQQIKSWEFNTAGDFEGWFDHENRMIEKQVSGGALQFSVRNQMDPQWRLNLGSLDARYDWIFEVVVRRVSGSSKAQPAFFVLNGNTDVQLEPSRNVALAGNNEWQSVKFRYKGGSLSSITAIRFDPATGQNGSWEIDSISVRDAKESSEAPVILGCLRPGFAVQRS
jgi:hypothetical protein